ncbi:J domain-containing protein [Afifella sp. IM 167]|uniref:J domain-containing protein n=1 Tax=Afifella sp. IM 167 TaxID=2033586 RepID=UPI00271481D4|nr:J domain-containing protein [Afifella sp. IM 167]MBZ8132357.1 molecular chaperone DnaJ [Afifella sp. IM 167]
MIRPLFLLIAAVAALFLLIRVAMSASPERLASGAKMGLGIALLLVAVFLGFARQFALALPAAIIGFGLVRSSWRRAVRGNAAQRSTVRSAGLEMTLDHETGEIDGTVLAGRHEGRELSKMSFEELRNLAGELAGDEESLRLLEGYLDRAHPRWRDDMETDADRGAGPAASPGGMSPQEAYEVLGLQPGAGEAEIRKAHRRLMKQVHPDRGGSTALAARINQAKETLLREHR